MSTNPTTHEVEDGFEVYYTEKLWEMIPPIYRLEDGLSVRPDVLRSLVEILAHQAAILRRSQDAVWDDSFIELCNDWAVPYLSELLGTRLVSASNPRGRRVDVAKTIYYRRRKGTLRVLEELISDITGWDGKVAEEFRRLARPRHGLDPHPMPLAGRITGTQPGGWADLRQPQGSTLVDSAFDEYHHTPDFRQHKGYQGRHNLPKLAFHLHRLVAYKVVNSTPFALGDGLSFTFDPSGRSIPLFSKRDRQEEHGSSYDWENWHSAMEWELPAPIRCRLLGESVFLFTQEVIDKLRNGPGLTAAEEQDLSTLIGEPIRGEARLRQTLLSMPSAATLYDPPSYALYLDILEAALVMECGKQGLLYESLSVLPDGTTLARERSAAGSLQDWDTSHLPPEKLAMLDPEMGRVAYITGEGPADPELHTVSYHYGFSGPIGAGTYDRREVEDSNPTSTVANGAAITAAKLPATTITQIEDNRTYTGLPDVTGVVSITLQAANQCRPYIRLKQDWVLDTDTKLNSTLVLDGLWIGADSDASIVLKGDYEKVVIRNCTLDPGGDKDILTQNIGVVSLRIEGHVEQLVVDHSITGPLFMKGATALVEDFQATDSILQSTEAAKAVELPSANACLERCTVLGQMVVHSIRSQDSIYTHTCTVQDTQQGCFRFSVAPPGSRVPRSYPYPPLDASSHGQWFTSLRLGQPGYGQLSITAPPELQRGAENGSELGAFCSLMNPIKMDSLQIKVAEYMPFGLIPLFILET